LRLLYLTGLRAGELLRLTHADLDLETGSLRIRHSKFNKSRLVPLAPDLVQRIVQCRVAAGERYGPVARTHRCSPARGEIDIPSPRSAAGFTTR
jgi:integrase